MKSIGILGGMGPEATVELYKRLVQVFQSRGAVYDEDFPTIYIYNLPAPDIAEKENDILILLINGLEKLRKMGSELLTISCNTATCIIEKNIYVPGFVSIVRGTVRKIKECKYRRVGLIGTKLTLKIGLYQSLLKKEGINLVLPTNKEKEKITKIILNILAGKKLSTDKLILEKIAIRMINEGADAIILGCTELPLLFNNSNIKTLDTIQILAEALVREACNGCDSTMDSVSVCGTEEAGSNPARGPKRGDKYER